MISPRSFNPTHSLCLVALALCPFTCITPALVQAGPVASVGQNFYGLSYQWLFNGQPIPDATNATLTIAAATRLNAGLYAVQVSNASGTERSANAALIVRGLQQLFAPLTLAIGALRLTFGDQHGDPISAPNALRYAVEVSADLLACGCR